MKKLIIFLFLGVVFSLTTIYSAAAKDCGGAIRCDCGDALTSSHTMWYDLINCSGAGLRIFSDDITLDCNNHIISGDNLGNEYGILLDGGRERLTIKNCNINNFYYGIYLITSNSLIEKCNIFNNSWGIYIASGSRNNKIKNVNVFDNSYGIYFSYGYSTLINNSKISSNENLGIGLYESNNNSIMESTIDKNYGGVSLSFSSFNNITKNNIYNNDRGIQHYPDSYNNSIQYNNLVDNDYTNLFNLGPSNISAENNWWGSIYREIIGIGIRDYYDYSSYGIIDFEPYLYGPFDGNQLPFANNLKCQSNGFWQECSNLIYSDILTKVRVNCTDIDGTITNAVFELKGISTYQTIFIGNGAFDSGYFVYNNDDLSLDYDGLVLSATCIDNNSEENTLTKSWLPKSGLPNSLLFYESFDGIDSISDNNGIINGNIKLIEIKCGKAANVTLNSYISYPLEGNFPDQTNSTIEFWVKNTKLTSQGFFDIGRLYGTNPNSMAIFHNGAIITEIRNNITYNGVAQMFQAWASGGPFIGTKWNHVAMTFSDYNKEDNSFMMTSYLNGNPGLTIPVNNFYPNLNNDFWVGRSGYYGYSNAYIDEFKIFNYAKSDDEIYDDYLYMKECTKEILPMKNCTMYKPESTGPVKINCSGLYVNNEPFTVKGVGYQPIPIGMTAESIPDKQKMYNDIRIRERDFPMLRAMGANTIRTWYQVLNKSFMDDLYNDGVDPIYVLMGFWINCKEDYGSASIRQKYIDEFTDYVNEYKDHPSVLAWMIGNENNLGYCLGSYSLADYNSLANELARIAYEIEGENYHPIAIINGDLGGIGETFYGGDDKSLNYTDFWGVNAYRGKSFGSLFEDYSQLTGKPMVVTEYGTDALNNSNYEEMQEVQVDWNIAQWKEIEANTLGGTVMAYSDEWWKGDVFGGCGDKWTHDYSCGHGDFPTPDGWSNEEWYGIMRTVENPDPLGADIMEPRLLYYAFQQEWSGEISFNHSLYEGWNLISVPLDSSNRSLASVLSSIQGSYDKVFVYQNNSWKELDKDDNIYPTMGLWVYMTKADTLSVQGYKIPPGSVWVYPGWNLVGFPYLEERSILDFPAANTIILSYNSTWSSYIPNRTFNSLQTLKPGYGYWVKAE